MALSFQPTRTNSPLSHHLVSDTDMSFLHDDDVHPELTDALLSFVYDPLDTADIDDFLTPLPVDDHFDAAAHRCSSKKARKNEDALLGSNADDYVCPDLPWNAVEFLTEFVLPSPPPQNLPPAFNTKVAQSAAARKRRKRISEKTAELARLVPGGHRLNTAEMLEEAGRHVKLLQAQVGMLALMHSVEKEKKKMMMPSMAQERMHALLMCGGVQERLAAEVKCLVPTKLVDAIAMDDVVRSNKLVNGELSRFINSLPKE